MTLRSPRKNAVLLAIAALFPAALVGVLTARAWGADRTGAVGAVAGALVTLLLFLFALYQLATAARSAVVVDDAGIERVGALSRRRAQWESIAAIAFNPAQHWFFVTLADGSHLWLPADVSGMGDFAEIALRKVPPRVLESADPVVREVLEELAEGAGQTPTGRP